MFLAINVSNAYSVPKASLQLNARSHNVTLRTRSPSIAYARTRTNTRLFAPVARTPASFLPFFITYYPSLSLSRNRPRLHARIGVDVDVDRLPPSSAFASSPVG